MGFFNIIGLAGFLAGGAIAWGPMLWIEEQYSTDIALSYFLLIALFASSIIGLLADRTVETNIYHSYYNNITQFYYNALGLPLSNIFPYNPYRRTLVFIWPLAIGPVCYFLLICFFATIDTIFYGNGIASKSEYIVYCGFSGLSNIIAFMIAFFTVRMRVIKNQYK